MAKIMNVIYGSRGGENYLLINVEQEKDQEKGTRLRLRHMGWNYIFFNLS